MSHMVKRRLAEGVLRTIVSEMVEPCGRKLSGVTGKGGSPRLIN